MTRAFIAALVPLLVACERITENPQRQPLRADLTGAAVIPAAVATPGTGTFTATLSALRDDVLMDYTISFSGLTGDATAIHLHGGANAANTGDLLVDFGALPAGSTGTVQLGDTAGLASGTLDLSGAITSVVSGDALHTLLHAGLVYIDVHTTTQPGGEIRGQIGKR